MHPDRGQDGVSLAHVRPQYHSVKQLYDTYKNGGETQSMDKKDMREIQTINEQDKLNAIAYTKKECGNQIKMCADILSKNTDVYTRLSYIPHIKTSEVSNKDDLKIVIIRKLSGKNIKLLNAELELIKMCNITASATLTRSIIEGVITQFYLGLIETDVQNYQNKLDFQMGKNPNKKFNENIKNLVDKYKFTNMKKALYTAENQSVIKKSYNLFNAFVHSDYRTNYEKNITPKLINYSLGLITELSTVNLLALVQSYHNTQYQNVVITMTGKYFGGLLDVLGEKIFPFIPNKQNVFEKFLFKDHLKNFD